MWHQQYGAHVDRLEKAAAQGKTVPALASRPDVPLWLLPALDAWADLGGAAPWWRVREWAEHYGVDFEWLLPTLRHAARAVDEYNEKLRKQQRGQPSRRRPRAGH